MEKLDKTLTLHDFSGQRNHGHVLGIVKNPRTLFAPGYTGLALDLKDNDRAYVVVDDYPKATDRLTVCAWVYADAHYRWATIAKNWRDRKRGQFHFGLRFDSGHLEVQIVDRHGKQVNLTANSKLPLKKWLHVAFVHTGSEIHLYQNAELIASKKIDGLSSTEISSLSIGTKLGDDDIRPEMAHSGSYWQGLIDELAIFNRDLSTEDLKELYLLSSQPPQE